MIRMEHISKVYGEASQVEAIKDIDLEVKENDFLGLIGPSDRENRRS